MGVVGNMIAGAAAGTAEHVVMYPIDSVKVRRISVADLVPVGFGLALLVGGAFFFVYKADINSFSFNFSIKPEIWIHTICSSRIWVTFRRRRGYIRTPPTVLR